MTARPLLVALEELREEVERGIEDLQHQLAVGDAEPGRVGAPEGGGELLAEPGAFGPVRLEGVDPVVDVLVAHRTGGAQQLDRYIGQLRHSVPVAAGYGQPERGDPVSSVGEVPDANGWNQPHSVRSESCGSLREISVTHDDWREGGDKVEAGQPGGPARSAIAYCGRAGSGFSPACRMVGHRRTCTTASPVDVEAVPSACTVPPRLWTAHPAGAPRSASAKSSDSVGFEVVDGPVDPQAVQGAGPQEVAALAHPGRVDGRLRAAVVECGHQLLEGALGDRR